MKQQQINFLSMCRSVQQILTIYADTWKPVPAFVHQVTLFKQLIADLSEAMMHAEIRSEGVTEHKLDAELKAVKHAVNLAKRASVFALDTHNTVLHDQLRVSRFALLHRPDNLTLSKVQDIYTRLQPLVPQLQHYGINDTDLELLNDLNQTFAQCISKPRTTIVERKIYNQEHIPELLSGLRLCLYKMDSLINLFSGTGLGHKYKYARKVLGLGSRHEQTDPEDIE